MGYKPNDCSWGRCDRPRISPQITDPVDRYRTLAHDGRYCDLHTAQITKTQAGRKAKRDAQRNKWRAEYVEKQMPQYEQELRRWQHIADCLAMADSAEPEQHDFYLQAATYLDAYKPKRPE